MFDQKNKRRCERACIVLGVLLGIFFLLLMMIAWGFSFLTGLFAGIVVGIAVGILSWYFFCRHVTQEKAVQNAAAATGIFTTGGGDADDNSANIAATGLQAGGADDALTAAEPVAAAPEISTPENDAAETSTSDAQLDGNDASGSDTADAETNNGVQAQGFMSDTGGVVENTATADDASDGAPAVDTAASVADTIVAAASDASEARKASEAKDLEGTIGDVAKDVKGDTPQTDRSASVSLSQATDEQTKPELLTAAREGGADDLKQIKGVGPKMEGLLHDLGVFHFDQVASWQAGEVAWVDANLEGFKGRITRDTWVEQARLLATGAETEFSKRVSKGKVY
ncbi:MAG: hypothetical protein JKX69_06175 [Rhodobacteraceae bacterium]|nr:hypothetical protein [Paracoccaceae bacterium]